MTETKAANKLKAQIASALADAHGDPEASAAILASLCTGVSMTISTMGRGNAACTSELLEGCISYLTERAIGFQKFGAIMNNPTAKASRR